MELFVVNRVGGEELQVTEEDERLKLEKVLQRVEQRRKRAAEKPEKKRVQKATLAPLPDNELLPDKNLDDGRNSVTTENHDIDSTETPSFEKKRKLDPATIEGFTVLGANNVAKRVKVKRVLPKWLANPTVISSNLHELTARTSKMKELDETIRKQLKANRIKYFFPVQAEVIPWLLRANSHADVVFPRDICVSAPTGSGKTLTFVLPVVQTLKRHSVRRVRALVILPTQDLAAQVFKTFKTYTQGTRLETCLITSNTPFEVQQKQLVTYSEAFGYCSKADILVCTAGRLVNHLKSTKGFDLQFLEFLIIDEADRVLDNVQNDWLYHLENHTSQDESGAKVLNLAALANQRHPQKLLFSATLSQDPEKLEKLSLFQPKLFTSVVENAQDNENDGETFIGKYTTPEELTEKFLVCSKDLKPLFLFKFIKREHLTKTLVFTNSIESAHRLMILLKSMFKNKKKIEEVSSSLKGKSRDELIAKFSNGEIDLLICTDSLARGIDVPGVQCVISYSAPNHVKTYIHRAGRTARAGEQGLAVTLLHEEQVSNFKLLLKHLKKNNVSEVEVDEEDLEPLGERYKKALDALKETLEKEKVANFRKVILTKRTSRKIKKKKVKN